MPDPAPEAVASYALSVDMHTARRQIGRVIADFDAAGLLESSQPPELGWSDLNVLLPEPDW